MVYFEMDRERILHYMSYGILSTPFVLLCWFGVFLYCHLGNSVPESSLVEQLIDIVPG